jgi:hypothetical protein
MIVRSVSILFGLSFSGCKKTDKPSSEAFTDYYSNCNPGKVVEITGPGIVPLHWDSAKDIIRRPRISMKLGNGQTVSAMFDSGASKSVMLLNGQHGYKDDGRLPDLANTLYRYLRFVDDKTLDVVKIVREEVSIVDARNPLGPLAIDFHLVKNLDASIAQHLGSGPTSNFTKEVGGTFGYLPNDYVSGSRATVGWLIFNKAQYCSPGTSIQYTQSAHDLYWTTEGSVKLDGDVRSTPVRWILDTGGISMFGLPEKVFAEIAARIQKSGKSKLLQERNRVRTVYRVTNCRASKDAFPRLILEIAPSVVIEVEPFWSGSEKLNYSSLPREGEEDTCRLHLNPSGDDSISVDLSTDVMTKLFFIFDANQKRVGVCPKSFQRSDQ